VAVSKDGRNTNLRFHVLAGAPFAKAPSLHLLQQLLRFPQQRLNPFSLGDRIPGEPAVLRSGQSKKQRRDIAAQLAAIPHAEECVIVATRR
jgi:hypothetical protein